MTFSLSYIHYCSLLLFSTISLPCLPPSLRLVPFTPTAVSPVAFRSPRFYSCGGLNEDVPHRLTCFNSWWHCVGKFRRRGLHGQSMLLEMGLESLKSWSFPAPSLCYVSTTEAASTRFPASAPMAPAAIPLIPPEP